MFRQTIHTLRDIHATAAPASTLLWVSLALLALFSVARAAPPQAFEPAVDVAAHAPAEVVTWVEWIDGRGQVQVTVDAAADDHYTVYLPGLDLTRVALRYDPEVAQHTGTVLLPPGTPRHGHCTLRLLDQSGRVWSFAVRLDPPVEEEDGC